MERYITADTHFGHENIIKYCNRPFKSLNHMNETLIKNWNERVKPEDVVYVVGDFCFRNSYDGKEGIRKRSQEWESELNGKIIHTRGNHDWNNGTKTIIQGILVNYGGFQMYLVHNPKHYNSNYKINLIGHIHRNFKIQHKRESVLINVGVDVNNFRPLKFQEVLKIYRKNIK